MLRIERCVEQKLGHSDGLAVLLDGDLDLAGAQSDGLHTDTLGEDRSISVNREVVVTHEVDRETGLNAKLRLLHSELLEAKHGHRLEQDLLGPDRLDSWRERAVRRVAGRGDGREVSAGNCATLRCGKGH